ncbi:HAD family hydrolase [Jeongeupia chitinilytica]|uniref:Haloacid dehalogenase n=1 Tax=Jeongeupia chitinilytica TaxID=1041641 RepID=A0ABQ3GWQ4_9NEIS|nr:HAD family hydrolase [Jeongeupia chitinilytica]GHD57140.1 haloacid dehalogenase [Jeongeupia chitinilytica]
MSRLLAILMFVAATAHADPLPSWQEGASKTAITGFVARISKEKTPDYLPPEARVAVFDVDEPLLYASSAELAFAVDEVKRLAPQRPEWTKTAPFSTVLAGQPVRSAADAQALIAATHDGSVDALTARVQHWLAEPANRSAAQGYAQVRELMAYLRTSGFRVWIVSSGDSGFVRPWAERAYGVPPEQVVASTLKARLALQGGSATIVRSPAFETVLTGAAKPVAVERVIGRRPVLAFGDSDTDLPLLQWVSAGRTRFVALLDRGDGAEQAQAAALNLGWLVVDAGRDWRQGAAATATATGQQQAASTQAEPSALVLHARDMLR